MKKRWQSFVLIIALLIFSSLVLSASADFWVKCQQTCPPNQNVCSGTGTATSNPPCCQYYETKNAKYCCKQGGGAWQTAECPQCDDKDGDRYILQSTNIALCGNVCGSGGNEACLGNNDCDDINANIHPGISENTNALCSDGLDNNCNKNNDNAWDSDPNTGKDCLDLSCKGKTGPGSVICCQAASDCGNDDCKVEACQADKTCSITNRPAGATDECSTCQACDVAGGNCVAQTSNEGKNCAGACTFCSAGACTNRAAGATDECGTCQQCNAAGPAGTCVGISAETGKNCINDCSDCVSGTCTATTENNDGTCTGTCTKCVSGSCSTRPANENVECSACNRCDGANIGCQAETGETGNLCASNCFDCVSGTCTATTENNDGTCTGTCTKCVSGSCSTRPANENVECSACNRCDGANIGCQAETGETGNLCASNCFDCVSGTCTATTENNDGACNDDCTSCSSGVCNNRNQCASNECAAGQFCDSAGGNCQAPDSSSTVCLDCVPDTTTLTWTWTPPNHQDAGKGFNANLFNSDAGPCSAASGGSCFDSNNNLVNHKSELSTGACCGDDASEFFKPDFFGAECTSNVNDCVWSTGDAQSSNTGNAKWWCFQHEWSECKDSTIGTKVGGVTCAGIIGNSAWTPNSLVKAENQYSCTDSIDNDGDGKIDCADSDCAGTISGSVKDADNNPLSSAKIDVLKNAIVVHTAFTNVLGSYTINDNQDVICGSYDMIASSAGYVSSTRTVQLQPNENKQNIDFTLTKGTTCESDCTYAGDNLIHKECQGINGCDLCNFGCAFCNPSIASNSCDLTQPGWIRGYNDPAQSECQATGCVIECGQGCPIAKIETKSSVTCDKENLIKLTKLVTYKGKLAKLVIVACG